VILPLLLLLMPFFFALFDPVIFSLRSRCRSCFFHCRRSFEVCGFFFSINLPFFCCWEFQKRWHVVSRGGGV
jgi:hypothetical protein